MTMIEGVKLAKNEIHNKKSFCVTMFPWRHRLLYYIHGTIVVKICISEKRILFHFVN